MNEQISRNVSYIAKYKISRNACKLISFEEVRKLAVEN